MASSALLSRRVLTCPQRAVRSSRVAAFSRPKPFTPARHVFARAAATEEVEEVDAADFDAELEEIMNGLLDEYGVEIDDEYEDDETLNAADEAARALADSEDVELAVAKDLVEDAEEKDAADKAVARRYANAIYKATSGAELTAADAVLLEEAAQAALLAAGEEAADVEEVIPSVGYSRAIVDDDLDAAITTDEKDEISQLKLSKLELKGLVPKDWDQLQTDFFTAKKGLNVPLPEYKLNIIWMEKNIGVAVDQVYSRGQTSPLTEYFFWPRNDAWEDLKVSLEQRPWVPEREKVILLNRLTQLINFWQDAEQKHTLEEARANFPDCAFQAS